MTTAAAPIEQRDSIVTTKDAVVTIEKDGSTHTAPILCACPLCGVRAIVELTPAQRLSQPDDTTHVCHPALGGCNHGFTDERTRVSLDPRPIERVKFVGERTHPLKRIRGKVARRSAKANWESGYTMCAYCGEDIRFPSDAAMYRPPSKDGRDLVEPVFTLADNARAVMGHKVCPLPLEALTGGGRLDGIGHVAATAAFCHCSHVQGGHLAGSGRCMVIVGDERCGCEHFVEESHCLGDCGAELNRGDDVNGYCRHCARLLATAGSGQWQGDPRD